MGAFAHTMPMLTSGLEIVSLEFDMTGNRPLTVSMLDWVQ